MALKIPILTFFPLLLTLLTGKESLLSYFVSVFYQNWKQLMLFQMQILSGCLSWYCFDVNIVIILKNINFSKVEDPQSGSHLQ